MHDEPVRIAAIAADGALVTVAGRTVRVIDVATGRIRGAPVVLPASPQRAAFASIAPVGVFSTGEYENGGRGELLHVVDFATGRLRGAPVRIDGMVGRLELDPYGTRALYLHHEPASTAALAGLVVIALGDGRRTCAADFPLVYDAVFARDGEHLHFVDHGHAVSRVALGSCRTLWRREFGGGGDFLRLAATREGAALLGAGSAGLTVYDDMGAARAITVPGQATARGALAVSRDGRRIALASRNAAHVFDLASGERLNPPFAIPIRGDDGIVALAFSPDASRLHARTSRRSQAVWEMTSDPRPVAELEAVIGQLMPGSDRPGARRLVDDRGTAAADPPRETPSFELDPTPATPDPRFETLDLAAIGSIDLAQNSGPLPRYPTNFPTIGRGPLRLRGVDWRIGPAVRLLHSGDEPRIDAAASATLALPVATRDLAAVHLLVHLVGFAAASRSPQSVLRVVLIGSDGRETPLEMVTRRDITSLGGFDLAEPTARVALLVASTQEAREAGAPGEYTPWILFAPRLEVPAGLPPTVAIRLEAASSGVMMIPAVTLEARSPTGMVSATPP